MLRSLSLRRSALILLWAALAVAAGPAGPAAAAVPRTTPLGEGLTLIEGFVNGVLFERDGKVLAFYGDPREEPARVDTVLFTHHRRDVVSAGRGLVKAGARAIIPAGEYAQFAGVEDFWKDHVARRFHDYSQQTARIPIESMPVAQKVGAGDTVSWGGASIEVIETPGYTRGAVTYLLEHEGKRIAFTGDLIYGDGKLLDLYSLQEAIPEAKIGGYHGYAGRIAQVLASLRSVAARRPDLIVPARGPVIRNPAAAVDRLLVRIREFYANYLSIDALRWYFGDEHIRTKARRVLGPDAKIDWMPFAQTLNDRPPAWIVPIGTSRLLAASDRSGFLVDCGSRQTIDELRGLREAGKVGGIDGIFITHYHDDHTDEVMTAARGFGCPIYACEEMRGILENPEAYRMPAMTANPIRPVAAMAEGKSLRWKEFTLTFSYFPGQTIYHGGLLARKDGEGEGIFFIGDSFTPSGIDDYCLLNRNFLHPREGYFACLDRLEAMGQDYLLINEHVIPTFRFSKDQIEFMRGVLRRRVEQLRELLPWDDPTYGLDEQWVRFHPYGQRVEPGQQAGLAVKIRSHSESSQAVAVRVRLPEGWTAEPERIALAVPAGREEEARFRVQVPSIAGPGVYVVTADVRLGEWDLREWTEALIAVAAGRSR